MCFLVFTEVQNISPNLLTLNTSPGMSQPFIGTACFAISIQFNEPNQVTCLHWPLY